jgi:hypothetical protein
MLCDFTGQEGEGDSRLKKDYYESKKAGRKV